MDLSEASSNSKIPALLLTLFCVLVFLAGLLMVRNSFGNALIVASLEIIFITIYLVLFWVPRKRYATIKLEVSISLVVVAWLASMTISLVISPYDLLHERLAIERLQVTVLHFFTFLVFRDLLSQFRLPSQWALIAIAASGLAVAFGMALIWFSLNPADRNFDGRWFWSPPFNSHIRHTGYQVAAGVSLLAPFFIVGQRVVIHRAILLFLFVGLTTFLFWMGGRGSVLGVYAAYVFLALGIWLKGVPGHRMWQVVLLATVLGLVLSETLAIFDWNGILDLIGRTVVASDLNQVTTGRSRLWLSAWESVREHPFFGLGPQGYYFMPNRILPNTIVTVQPHSFIVQFVVEWGFIGAALFSFLLLYAFYRGVVTNILLAKGEVDITRLSAGTMIVALTIHGLSDGTFYHPQPSLYLAIAFAIWTLPGPAQQAQSSGRLKASEEAIV